MKRDDLTGLGFGGNKARELKFLCGDAVEGGSDCLVTVRSSRIPSGSHVVFLHTGGAPAHFGHNGTRHLMSRRAHRVTKPAAMTVSLLPP